MLLTNLENISILIKCFTQYNPILESAVFEEINFDFSVFRKGIVKKKKEYFE